MITLNGTAVVPKHFSDGTLDIKIDPAIWQGKESAVIEWRYDDNEELVSVYFLARHLQSKGVADVELRLPYIPNARKDRAQREKDVFSLKYFAEIINSLHFSRVVALDPHSIVSEALIDRIRVITPERLVEAVLAKLDGPVTMFYPDEGAVKRYAERIGRDFVYGSKHRDKETRVIRELRIEGEEEQIRGKNILMVDDICASGKTLCIAAKKLKELGAKDLYVFVSHCENTVIGSDLLDVITKLYTTDSILREAHPKIETVSL